MTRILAAVLRAIGMPRLNRISRFRRRAAATWVRAKRSISSSALSSGVGSASARAALTGIERAYGRFGPVQLGLSGCNTCSSWRQEAREGAANPRRCLLVVTRCLPGWRQAYRRRTGQYRWVIGRPGVCGAPSVGREKDTTRASGGSGTVNINYCYRLSKESIESPRPRLRESVIPKGFSTASGANGVVHPGEQG